MDYTIDVGHHSGICHICASGTLRRPQDSLVLIRRVGEVVKEHHIFRILFDLRKAEIIGTTSGAFEAVVDSEKYGVGKQLRIAVVYSTITEEEQFMENVGVNRGAFSFKVFDDIRAARKWIAR